MRLEDVFGIGPGRFATYVERAADESFQQCLRSKKHIVLHGSSKQGKTSLRKRYLSDEDAIVVACQSNWDLPQLYIAILRRAGCRPTLTQHRTGTGHNIISMHVGLPGIGQVEFGREPGIRERIDTTYREVDPNDPNDVIDGLKDIGFNKWIIVEDFHYLPPATQREFATHLKAFFDESEIRFLLVAIWIGRNRFTALGDLAGRVVAVDADFWPEFDLREVIERGERALNVRFEPPCKQEITKVANGSVYMVQSICQGICQLNEIFETQAELATIGHKNQITPIVDECVSQFSDHYISFIQEFSQGHQATTLEMHKWIVYVLLTAKLDQLRKGLLFPDMLQAIRGRHPQGAALSPGSLRNALKTVDELQWNKKIRPFVIDYDEASRRLYVVDRSFFLWRKCQRANELLRYLDLPPETEPATA